MRCVLDIHICNIYLYNDFTFPWLTGWPNRTFWMIRSEHEKFQSKSLSKLSRARAFMDCDHVSRHSFTIFHRACDLYIYVQCIYNIAFVDVFIFLSRVILSPNKKKNATPKKRCPSAHVLDLYNIFYSNQSLQSIMNLSRQIKIKKTKQ